MQKTSILLMHCKEMEKQQKIRKLCQRFGMECRMLTEKDGKEELGVLCATYPVAVGKHEMPPFAWADAGTARVLRTSGKQSSTFSGSLS